MGEGHEVGITRGYRMSGNKEEDTFLFPKKLLFDCLTNHSVYLIMEKMYLILN